MTRYLSLDLGLKRTGVATIDSDTGVPLALDTLEYGSEKELIRSIGVLIATRKIDHLLIGLPLLLSGQEGDQSAWVRHIAGKLQSHSLPISFVDERFSSDAPLGVNPDSFAALSLIDRYISHLKKVDNTRKDI